MASLARRRQSTARPCAPSSEASAPSARPRSTARPISRQRNSLCECGARRVPSTSIEVDVSNAHQRIGKQTEFAVCARVTDHLCQNVVGTVEVTHQTKACTQIGAHLGITLELIA